MLRAKNCTYHDGCIEIMEGQISIDLYNKAVFVDSDESKLMFDAFKGPITVSLTRKPISEGMSNGTTIVLV